MKLSDEAHFRTLCSEALIYKTIFQPQEKQIPDFGELAQPFFAGAAFFFSWKLLKNKLQIELVKSNM